MRVHISLIAALFLATGTAHADVTLSPMHPLIGSWCEPHVPEDRGLYNRGSSCDNLFAISRDGYGGEEDNCTFLEIKRIRNGIEAFSRCTADSVDKPIYYQNTRVQIIGKRLKFEILKEYNFKTARIDTGDTHRSMCVEVQPTPDGYLNVRQGPGMNFKPIAKLVPGQRIMVDLQTDEWTHVRSGCDEGARDGWVYNKYVKDIDGSNIKTLPPPQTEISPKAQEDHEPRCDIPGCDGPPPGTIYDYGQRSPPPVGRFTPMPSNWKCRNCDEDK